MGPTVAVHVEEEVAGVGYAVEGVCRVVPVDAVKGQIHAVLHAKAQCLDGVLLALRQRRGEGDLQIRD